MGAGDEGEAAAAPVEVKVKGERIVWMVWALFSFFVNFYVMLLLREKLLTQRLGHPLDEGAGLYPPLVQICILVLHLFHCYLLLEVTFSLETEPLKLDPRARLLIVVAFVLFCFGLAFWKRDDDDIWFVLLGFGICLQLIPTFNLLASFWNFTALDTARALLIQAAAAFVSRTYPPYVVALLSLALILINISSYYIEQLQHIQLSETTYDNDSIV